MFEEQNQKMVKIVIGAILILFILQIVSTTMNFISVRDRAELRQQQNLIERLQAEAAEREKTNQIMLAARKEIQGRGINALNRNDLWTDEDKRIIAANWDAAQYDGLPNPFPEYTNK